MGQPVRTLDKTVRFVDDCEHKISLYEACPECARLADMATKMFAPATDRHMCQDCTRIWKLDQLKPVRDLDQRVGPGETVPTGECPKCGAVCHPAE